MGSPGSSSRPSPTVSVIIPAYNAAPFIAETLDSVFAQSFKEFEVIVINDGSPDTDLLERAITPYRNKILYVKQENRGPSAARNLGIRSAKSEFVAFVDGDDSWLPEYLTVQMKMFEETPSLDLLCSDAQLFTDSGPIGETFLEQCPSKSPATFVSLLLEESHIVTSGTVARRQTLLDAGLFDENFIRSEDWDLWLRVAHGGGKILYQRNPLSRHRINPSGLSSDIKRMIEAVVQVLVKLERVLPLSPQDRTILQDQLKRATAFLENERAKGFVLEGDFGKAKNSLRKANDFFHSARLALAIFGLQFAPRLTRFGLMAREKFARWRFQRLKMKRRQAFFAREAANR